MFQEKVRYIKRIGDMTGYSYIEGEYIDFSLQASVDEDYDIKGNGVRRYFKITAISKSGAKTTLN